MDEEFRQKVRNLYRVNRILWFSIFGGVAMLLLVGYLFYYMGSIPPRQTSGADSLGTIVLIIALVLLYVVFHMKRTYLDPKKLVWRAKQKNLQITNVDLADFMAQFGERADVMAKTLILLRRYYMVIWSIANLITLLGFIEFIITGEVRVLFVYGLVSVYSLLINYPSFKIIERCYEIING
ncbi:hypothetical protein [Caldithrix abyssi]